MRPSKHSPALSELRAFMEEHGLKPADLARGAHLSKAAAGAIHAGKSLPEPQTRVNIETWTGGRAKRADWDTRLRPSRGVEPFRPAARAA